MILSILESAPSKEEDHLVGKGRGKGHTETETNLFASPGGGTVTPGGV